ncbi:MAG: hypothetical protein AB1756_09145 [Acidobacteriota bacterium]
MTREIFFFLLFYTFPLCAQTIEKIILVEPENGKITNNKPLFKILVEGDDISPSTKYRIELSRDDFETVEQTFEQISEKRGWSIHEYENEKGAIYRAQKPLPDGVYQWRASVYDGISYIDGKQTSSFIVDSIPPVEVTGLDLEFDPTTGFTHLRWDSVFLDANGNSEQVDHYNIYRYEKRSFFFVIRVFYIGSTETTSFIDKDVNKNIPGKVIYYKVVAVDKAGNELGRKY